MMQVTVHMFSPTSSAQRRRASVHPCRGAVLSRAWRAAGLVTKVALDDRIAKHRCGLSKAWPARLEVGRIASLHDPEPCRQVALPGLCEGVIQRLRILHHDPAF